MNVARPWRPARIWLVATGRTSPSGNELWLLTLSWHPSCSLLLVCTHKLPNAGFKVGGPSQPCFELKSAFDVCGDVGIRGGGMRGRGSYRTKYPPLRNRSGAVFCSSNYFLRVLAHELLARATFCPLSGRQPSTVDGPVALAAAFLPDVCCTSKRVSIAIKPRNLRPISRPRGGT